MPALDIHRLASGRDFDACADRRDLAVSNDHSSVGHVRPGDGMDRGSDENDRLSGRRDGRERGAEDDY